MGAIFIRMYYMEKITLKQVRENYTQKKKLCVLARAIADIYEYNKQKYMRIICIYKINAYTKRRKNTYNFVEVRNEILIV